ncbi:GIY-YIG nuclease family protein [Novosphingobium resinovorum]|jgi:putative endonuclease|nr:MULTISPECIES: GIY-YIG nuclease family protein [Sphingomonadaceae]EJU10333.1 excinuclease ABC subunit C [Sphingomonas sp. LH128]MBF7010747.1 GIY-YIG nuclease family protein [Novosphingobium sp. HR1a]WJM28744.1 GIY-YIG nuclease family protein [Novosphingobium resinovorum]
MEKGGFSYIMANRPFGVLYVGVTNDIHVRMHQHYEGRGSRFCQRYGIDRLVLVEPHGSIQEAIAREKQLKAWRREWKLELIEQVNPIWDDLSGLL